MSSLLTVSRRGRPIRIWLPTSSANPMQPPSPLYHPPGQPFTIWTRKVLGLAIPEPARYHLLGGQFTVWTRSLPRPEPAPEPKLATPPPVAAVPAAKVSWAGSGVEEGLNSPITAGVP